MQVLYRVTLFLRLILLFFQRNEDDNRSDNDQRIVGGEEAAIHNYPYQSYLVLYRGNETYQCGGSIISYFHILTAAHCLERIDYVIVRIGSNQAFEGGTTYRSSQLITHQDYNSRTFEADIAIIRVSRRMVLDGINSARISIPRQNYYPLNNTEMAISGWGATGEGEPTTTTMRATTVNVHSITYCQQRFGNTLVTNRSFCAGPLEGGRDTCQGDSGGPGKNVANNVQIGVVSNGFGCARPNSPGIYTNVGSFTNWIRVNTGGMVTFADPEDYENNIDYNIDSITTDKLK
ncbi:hypothetical protein K1T71_005208 [Dendrolimus kikuchii]|uniref:Uncharacterized protein n=1 Tax=Dendrolimus kikuchii TaxID=765133 RepID=A0ACC1D6R2_9NEOP|nr:hypothetical protein K1T71_005208 [Dendrolimus kikuchii]